jgi:hypothetical protein
MRYCWQGSTTVVARTFACRRLSMARVLPISCKQDDDDKGKRPVYDSSDEEGVHQDGKEGGEGAVSGAADCEGGPAPASPRVSEDAGDLTCAICLCGIPLENMALVKVGRLRSCTGL